MQAMDEATYIADPYASVVFLISPGSKSDYSWPSPNPTSKLPRHSPELIGHHPPGIQIETSRFPQFAASRVRRRYVPTATCFRHPTSAHTAPLRGPFRSTGQRDRQVVQPRERLWVRRTFRWLR